MDKKRVAWSRGYIATRIEENPYIDAYCRKSFNEGFQAAQDADRRVALLNRMKQLYCANDAEDKMDGSEFDLDVIAAIDALIKKYGERANEVSVD